MYPSCPLSLSIPPSKLWTELRPIVPESRFQQCPTSGIQTPTMCVNNLLITLEVNQETMN